MRYDVPQWQQDPPEQPECSGAPVPSELLEPLEQPEQPEQPLQCLPFLRSFQIERIAAATPAPRQIKTMTVPIAESPF